MSESVYGILIVVGPLVLAAALIWAMLNNRTSRRQEQATEEATARRYDEQDAADKGAR
jgi:hypothetical protein